MTKIIPIYMCCYFMAIKKKKNSGKRVEIIEILALSIHNLNHMKVFFMFRKIQEACALRHRGRVSVGIPSIPVYIFFFVSLLLNYSNFFLFRKSINFVFVRRPRQDCKKKLDTCLKVGRLESTTTYLYY